MSMNVFIGTQKVTADSVIGTSGKAIKVYGVHLVSGGTASTCTLKNGTSTSGAAYAQIDGTASVGVTISFNGGKYFPAGCFFDADANISYATVDYAEYPTA